MQVPTASSNAIRLKLGCARVFYPLLAPARYKAAFGGRGSGKSHFFAELVVERCLMAPTRVVCIREIQRDLKGSSKQLIEDKIRDLGVGAFFRVMEDRIEVSNGGHIIFQGMQNHTSDSIKSLEAYDIAWVEEAQSLSRRSLRLLRPTLRKKGSELWFSWNPRNRKDPVDQFFRGEVKPPRATIVQANFRDNPWFHQDTELVQEMEHDLAVDKDAYRHVWLGAYESRSSVIVFKNWKKGELSVPADLRPYYGADWGFAQDPSVIIRCHFITDRLLYIDKESYDIECPLDHTPALFAGDCPYPESDKRHWDNPSQYVGVPGALEWPVTADSARPETIDHMKRRGFNIVGAKKGPGSLEEGVEFLRTLDIIVHPDCEHVIDELTLYQYKVDKQTEDILPKLQDQHNHTIDAIRYAIETVRRRRAVHEGPESVIAEEPIDLPSIWPRAAAIIIDGKFVTCIWMANDTKADTIHIYDLYSVPRTDMAIHAAAIKRRGQWIPAIMAEAEKPAMKNEVVKAAQALADMRVSLSLVDFDMPGAVEVMSSRLSGDRLRVSRTISDWFTAYRGFGRDEKGDLVTEDQPIMRATALVAMYGDQIAMSQYQAESDMEGPDPDELAEDRSSTGY